MPTLVVQKGHCYRSTGATGTNGEQAFATAVADACVALLNGLGGWTVRPILADAASSSYRGDAFVAIHADGSINTSVRGASVGYRTPEGQALGQAWKRAYADRGWPGGFRPDNYTAALAGYYGTGTAVAQGNRRAFIVECGFLTSPDDRAVLTAPDGPSRVALAIGDALGIPLRQPAPPQAKQGDDMPFGTFKPAPDPTTPGHLNVIVDPSATSARFEVYSGWTQKLLSWNAYCLDSNGNYTNGANVPFRFGPEKPDKPDRFGVPAGTAAIAIEYVTAPDNTDEVAWRLFETK